MWSICKALSVYLTLNHATYWWMITNTVKIFTTAQPHWYWTPIGLNSEKTRVIPLLRAFIIKVLKKDHGRRKLHNLNFWFSAEIKREKQILLFCKRSVREIRNGTTISWAIQWCITRRQSFLEWKDKPHFLVLYLLNPKCEAARPRPMSLWPWH